MSLFIFFRAHRALLLKFIVLQICRREPFRIVCGGDSGYVNMRHAFTIIDIWCVFFISQPQLVHIHTHTSHMHSHLPIHFHFYSKCSTLSNCYCYRVICLLAINAIVHYLFHRFYCKYLKIKRDKFHWGENVLKSVGRWHCAFEWGQELYSMGLWGNEYESCLCTSLALCIDIDPFVVCLRYFVVVFHLELIWISNLLFLLVSHNGLKLIWCNYYYSLTDPNESLNNMTFYWLRIFRY